MARVGAIEGFVAKREIRNDVAFYRRLEQRPLETGRVAQMAALDLTVGADAHPGEDISAEAFHERDAATRTGCRARIHRFEYRPGGQLPQDLLDKRGALGDLLDAYPHARIDVACLHHRDIEVQPVVRSVAGRAARIE